MLYCSLQPPKMLSCRREFLVSPPRKNSSFPRISTIANEVEEEICTYGNKRWHNYLIFINLIDWPGNGKQEGQSD